MNLATVTGWAGKHRLVLGGGVAAGAVALGLRARARRGAGDTPGTTRAGAMATPQSFGGAGYYDSTASDVYNSIQPEIDRLAEEIGKLKAPRPAPKTSTPHPPAKPKPKPKPKAHKPAPPVARRPPIVHRPVPGQPLPPLAPQLRQATNKVTPAKRPAPARTRVPARRV